MSLLCLIQYIWMCCYIRGIYWTWCHHGTSHAMAQAVSCWASTVELWIQFQASLCDVCGRQYGTGTGFSVRPQFFPISIIPSMLHSRSFICRQYHIILASHNTVNTNHYILVNSSDRMYVNWDVIFVCHSVWDFHSTGIWILKCPQIMILSEKPA
jgi:hypothetical protein